VRGRVTSEAQYRLDAGGRLPSVPALSAVIDLIADGGRPLSSASQRSSEMAGSVESNDATLTRLAAAIQLCPRAGLGTTASSQRTKGNNLVRPRVTRNYFVRITATTESNLPRYASIRSRCRTTTNSRPARL